MLKAYIKFLSAYELKVVFFLSKTIEVLDTEVPDFFAITILKMSLLGFDIVLSEPQNSTGFWVPIIPEVLPFKGLDVHEVFMVSPQMTSNMKFRIKYLVPKALVPGGEITSEPI